MKTYPQSKQPRFKTAILIGVLFLSGTIQAFATWSIIIIDPKTHEIGIAGASCSYNCYGIGKIIPNIGAIIVQAMSNSDARAKGIQLIIAGSTPEQIVQALRDPAFDPERQQYAIVTVKYMDQPATYTGDSTHENNGALTANGVSVQGNTLASKDELQLILAAVLKGQKELLPVSEILMNALEVGSTTGGDRRCGEQRATSAFLILAKPEDRKPYLVLNIFGQKPGGPNAVGMLRTKLEKWKRKHGVSGY